MTVSEALARLNKSSFRAKFHLSKKDMEYIDRVKPETIRTHAMDLITARLAPAFPKNDGRQTPMRGHPVFIAQHATATCCRGCLEKWYKIPKGIELSEEQIDGVVTLILAYIEAERRRAGQ